MPVFIPSTEWRSLLGAINRTGRLWSSQENTQAHKSWLPSEKESTSLWKQQTNKEQACKISFEQLHAAAVCSAFKRIDNLWSSQKRMCERVYNVNVSVFLQSVESWAFRCCSEMHPTGPYPTTAVTSGSASLRIGGVRGLFIDMINKCTWVARLLITWDVIVCLW